MVLVAVQAGERDRGRWVVLEVVRAGRAQPGGCGGDGSAVGAQERGEAAVGLFGLGDRERLAQGPVRMLVAARCPR